MAEVEASAGGFSASDDEFGLRLAGGARYWVTPSEIELNAELVYTTVFDGDFSIRDQLHPGRPLGVLIPERVMAPRGPSVLPRTIPESSI
jgi:hypothetical protein